MIHNKKFLFVEAVLFIAVIVFALQVGVRDTYASLNQLNAFGLGSWSALDVTSDGSTVLVSIGSAGQNYISSNAGNNASATGETRDWIDIYEAGGSFVAVSNSNGDYIHEYNGGSWSMFTNGPQGPFTSVAKSDDGTYMIVTKSNQNFAYYLSGSWTNIDNYFVNWTDSAMSSNGQYTLLSSDSGLYFNDNFVPGSLANLANVQSGNFTKVAMNDDGSKMIAISSSGVGFRSAVNDPGMWTSSENMTGIKAADVSNTGTIVVAKSYGGLYYSVDNDTTWQTIDAANRYWSDIKINDQGTKIYAAEQGGYVYSFDIDSAPPVRSNGAPLGLVGETTSVDMTLNTDETATCRYSSTSSSSYDDMNNFSSTNSTSHSVTLTSLNPSTSFTYYVKCKDQYNNVNSDDYSISFSTAADTTPPSISGGSPSGVLPEGTTSVQLSVSTNENATCKYGNIAGTSYASISNTFSTTGGTTHTQTISGLTADTSYTYYVRCSDSVSNVNTSDTTISFSIPADEEESSSSSGSGGMNVDLESSCSVSDTTIKVGEEIDIDVDVEITKDGEDEDYTFKWTKVLTGTDQTTSISFDTPGEYTPKGKISSQYKDEVITCDTITVTDTSTKDESEEDENIITKTTETITATYETIITLYNQYIQTIQNDSTNTRKLDELLEKIREQFSLIEMTRLEQQSVFQFTKDLQFGMTDPEVKLLQQFLNAQGYLVAQTGPGSKGNETNIFGIATRAALISFQKANNITPAIGYFGSVTRGVVNSLLN